MKVTNRFIMSFLLVCSLFFFASVCVADDICINTSLAGYIPVVNDSGSSNYTSLNLSAKYRMQEVGDPDTYSGKALESYTVEDGSLSSRYSFAVPAPGTTYYVWARAKGANDSNNKLLFHYKNNGSNWVGPSAVAFAASYEWKRIYEGVPAYELSVENNNGHDGVRFDGFYVTTDANDTPVDCGGTNPSTSPEDGVCGDIPLYTQNLTYPAMMVQLDVSGSMASKMLGTIDGRNFHSNDLSRIIQEMVNRPDWDSGDNIPLRVIGQYKLRNVYTKDSGKNKPPLLTIKYLDLNDDEQEVTFYITNSADDVSFHGNTINTDAGYFELGEDHHGGFLFRNITIPKGATIIDARMRFLCEHSSWSNRYRPTRLEIRAITDPEKTSFIKADFGPDAAISENWAFLNYTRLDYAVTTLESIFMDKGIAWGFATWTGLNDSGSRYTQYHVGIKENTFDHYTNLRNSIYSSQANGNTPLTPSLLASKDYFDGNRADQTYKEKYVGVSCQPKVVITVTDGQGNTGTTNVWDSWGTATNDVINSGVSVVAIGFGPGISNPSASYQLSRIAQVAQQRGNSSDLDKIYGLHNEEDREVDNVYSDSQSILPVSGGVASDASIQRIGVPFLGAEPEVFVEAMNQIVSSIKVQQYQGVAPSPTTSSSDEGLLVSASFNPDTWEGDIEVNKIDPETGKIGDKVWKASEIFAENGGINNNNCYMYDPSTGSVGLCANVSNNDNYLCKYLGDIINSEPKIVSRPPYFYDFDGYEDFKYNYGVRGRDSMIYVGSNDGAVHAFLLEYGSKWDGHTGTKPKLGTEMWRFYPKSVLAKIDQDMCAEDYCHQYLNDGSPQAADIYNGTDWKTILIGGLGRGGAGFYALDITYGNDWSPSLSDPSRLLWEFTADDAPQLGMATAVPVIARVDKKYNAGNAEDGSTWVTFLGSGTAVDPTHQVNRNAHIYALNAWDKTTIWEDDGGNPITRVKFGNIDPNNPTALLANDIPSSPLVIDSDDDDKRDRIYVGNRYGSLFRIKNIGVGETPVVETLYDSEKATHESPVTGKPAYAYGGGNDDAWIYFGTGKYETNADKTTDYQQYLFGLKDESASQSIPYKYDDLRKCQLGRIAAMDGTVYRTVSCDSGSGPWVLKLERTAGQPSERITTKPLIIGGIVYFTTFIPGTDICGESGKSYIVALDWRTGNVPAEDPFTDIDDTVTIGDQVYTVVGKEIGAGVATGVNALGDEGYFATSNDGIANTGLAKEKLNAKLKSWKQDYN